MAPPAAASAARATVDRGILLEDAQADLLDLVAQRRRTLELEVAGRLAHVGLELGHELGDLLARQLAEVTRRLARRIAARPVGDRAQAVVDVADLLDDRGRLDAVLRVVGLLDAAPAIRLVDRRRASTR